VGETPLDRYPATTYDLPDLAINTTDIYHAAVRWASGDSCVWIASDTDGTDDPCGQPLPNLFSLVSTDSYATAAIPANVANWALKLNWR
jgi:hypothetical protein